MSKVVLRGQMNDVFNTIALGLLSKEISAEDVVEGKIIEAAFAVAKAKMDGGFDHEVPIAHPIGRTKIDVVIIHIAHGDPETVAESAKVFVYGGSVGEVNRLGGAIRLRVGW